MSRGRSTVQEPGKIAWLAILLASLVVLAALIGLGAWQVERLHWKEALIAQIEARRHGAPQPLAEIEQQYAQTGDVDYTPVTVAGTFRHAGERHFLATWHGQSGFYVYTPLELAGDRIVFVNRGFVPYDRKNPATRAEGQVEGPVVVTGLARNPLSEKPSFLVPTNDPAQNIFFWKDRDAFAATAGLAAGSEIVPIFIDADATPNPGGLPQGGVTIVDLPNSHLQYAMTWYGLAAALAGVVGVWLWRARRPALTGERPDRMSGPNRSRT